MAEIADHPARTFTIGELAREFGLTARSIRFYEDEGLLAPVREGTARVYGHRDRARLVLICRGKRLGFSVREIKEFLDLYDAADPRREEQMRFLRDRCEERIEALEVQLGDVRRTLSELRSIRERIDGHLSGGEAADRPRAASGR
jgi:DNA-binding transcriptional MerR regulator